MDGEVGSITLGFLLPRVVAVAALVAANGFFVSLEFALVASRRTRLETLSREGKAVARLALHMMEHTDLYIAAAQLGITLASLALGWVGESTVAAIVYPLLDVLFGHGMGTVASHVVGTVLSFTLITFLHIILGEQVPKIIAIREPEQVALVVARPMQVFTLVFRPFIWVLDRATALVLRLLGVKEVVGHHRAYSLEELKLLVEQSEEQGLIPVQEREILSRVFDFGQRQVHEAMIPRPEIVGISERATVDELLQIFKEHRHARFPVYEEDLDHIVGIIAIKDVLALLADHPEVRNKPIKELGIIQPALAVPETLLISDLFQEMRDKHVQMAIVIDEYGGTAGLVTLEELTEEIMGRVTDEWVREEPQILRVSPNTFEVNAQLRVDEVNEELGLSIPENDLYETVAGFLLYHLGHVPQVGETYRWDNLLFRVQSMKGPKIERVSITLLGEEAQTEKQADSAQPEAETISAPAATKEAHVG